MQNQPRPVIKLACPYAECSGENPPQARYCATCGRALRIGGREEEMLPTPTAGGGALVGFSIAAFVMFVLFSIAGVWRHTPLLMFLPFAIFAVGIGRDRRRRRRWRHWD